MATAGHQLRHPSLRPLRKSQSFFSPRPVRLIYSTFPCSSRGYLTLRIRSSAGSTSPKSAAMVEQPGGKMVAELVGTFNELTERMDGALSTSSSSSLLFKSLKLSIPLLQALPFAHDGRPPLSRALSLSLSLFANLVSLTLTLKLVFLSLQ